MEPLAEDCQLSFALIPFFNCETGSFVPIPILTITHAIHQAGGLTIGISQEVQHTPPVHTCRDNLF